MNDDPPSLWGPPPGWYRDPTGDARQRYWNGARWTDQVRRRRASQVVGAGRAALLVLSVGLLLPVLLPLGLAALAVGTPSDPCTPGQPCGPDPWHVAAQAMGAAIAAAPIAAGAITLAWVPHRLGFAIRMVVLVTGMTAMAVLWLWLLWLR